MKKIITASLLSLLASASLFGAQASVQIFGNGFTLDKETLPTGAKVGKVGKAGVSVDFDIGTDKWKNVKLRGNVEKNATLRFIFSSKKSKTASAVMLDNLKLDGELLPNGDFASENFDGWILSKKKKNLELTEPSVSNGGGKAVLLNVGDSISRNVAVKAGKGFELSLDFLGESSWNDSDMIDISPDCNVVAGDSVSFAKNLKAPKKPKLYGGMMFNFADNNGKPNVLYLKPSQSQKYEIKSKISAKYLYLMYSAEKCEKIKTDAVKVAVHFVSGRTRSRVLKVGEDIKYFSSKVEALDNALQVHTDNKKAGTGGVYITRVDLAAGGTAEPIKWVEIRSMVNLQVYGATLSSREVFTTEILKYPADKWVELDMSDLDVKEGSALDVSNIANHHMPAGKFGRVVVGKNGDFEFEKRPNEPIRFKGANIFTMVGRIGNKIKTKEDIDLYVKMFKKQGYNAVRWRFSVEDGILNEKGEVKEEYLDLYDYFLYALKREGIYSYFYITSHDVGVPNFNWNDRTTIKMRMMLGDKQIREVWRKYAIHQLTHVNKYTGVAWKDEPAIATIEYWNEFDLGFGLNRVNAATKAILTKRLQEFLKDRYKTIDAFLAYNKQIKCEWVSKKPLESFDDISLDLYHSNSYHPDFGRFAIYLMQDVLSFFRKVVFEEIGCKPTTFQNNCSGHTVA